MTLTGHIIKHKEKKCWGKENIWVFFFFSLVLRFLFLSQCSILKTFVMNALHLKATALGQLILVSGLLYDPEGWIGQKTLKIISLFYKILEAHYPIQLHP